MAERGYGSSNYGKSKKSENLSILKSQIRAKNPAKVYLFFGTESFLIDYYAGEIKKIIAGNDTNGLNVVTFENKVDVIDVIDACDTFPVFSDKKLVIVKNSGLFFRGKKSETTKFTSNTPNDQVEKISSNSGNKSQQVLKDYIPSIPDTTCLVFIESNVDKRLSAYKQIVKNGVAAEFNRLGSSELVPWVAKGFKSFSKIISPEAAQYLVSISEPDMYTLKNEILKISNYVGERQEINLNDIKLLATPTIKSVIFDLLDAVSQKNAPEALKLLDDMLTIKEPEQKILSMLSKQTGEILKLKILLNSGANQSQINQYFQGKHPYALKMLTRQAKLMDEQYLRKLLKACMETDISYKKGLMNVKLALEVLLSKISI